MTENIVLTKKRYYFFIEHELLGPYDSEDEFAFDPAAAERVKEFGSATMFVVDAAISAKIEVEAYSFSAEALLEEVK